jgi:hypothetical protein
LPIEERLLEVVRGEPTCHSAVAGCVAIKCYKSKSFPFSAFRFPFFIIFAPEKIEKLYQNKKIGGDEAIFSPSKESNPQHT